MIITTTRPTVDQIVLGTAGASTSVVLDTNNKEQSKTGAEIVADFISAKKWGYNRPNYLVEGDVIYVSKWAIGQVIGKRGKIVKAIQKMYGYVQIKALPYERDDQYFYVKKFYTSGGNIRKVEIANSWFRIKRDKCNSGMYDRYISEKTGYSYSESEICVDQQLCKKLEKLGEVKNPILPYDYKGDKEGLYFLEQYATSDVYCTEEGLDLLVFFGYNKDDFKKYEVASLIEEAIEKFFQTKQDAYWFEKNKNEAFYLLRDKLPQYGNKKPDPIVLIEMIGEWEILKADNSIEAKESIKALTTKRISAFKAEQVEIADKKAKKDAEIKAKAKAEAQAKAEAEAKEKALLEEFHTLEDRRRELGMSDLFLKEWGQFKLDGKLYYLSEESIELIKEDIKREEEIIRSMKEREEYEKEEENKRVAKKDEAEEMDNPFANFFGS